MNLHEYLKKENISSAAFASRLGVSVSAVKKWRALDRIPRPEHMVDIETLTRSKVSPSDWYKPRT